MTQITQTDPKTKAQPTQGAGTAQPAKPEQAAGAPPADKGGTPAAGNSAALSGKPGQSALQLPGQTTVVQTKKVTTVKTETIEETTTTTTTTGGPAPADKPADKPAEQPAAEKVPDYADKFGNASYVKDGANQDMRDLAQKVVDKNPALKDSDLAKHLKDGTMGPEDVKALQNELKAQGFDVGSTGVDGKYGPKTHAALQKYLNGEKPDPKPADTTGGTQPGDKPADKPGEKPADAPASDADLEAKLKAAAEHSQYNEGIHKCFKYAWDVTRQTGGKGIGSATQSHDGRGQPITHLDQMIKDGKLKPGDVIYANKSPGADPTSTKLQYGPHWFVYMGNGKFADQYHNRSTGQRTKTAAEMQQFVRGRVIDTIYHTH